MKTLKLRDDFYWAGIVDDTLRVFDIIMYTEFGTTYNSYAVSYTHLDVYKRQQYDRYHTWMILLLGMHMLFLCSYLLQLKITPDSGYSRSVFLVLFLSLIHI